jgi:hypothetical protein
MCLKPSNVNEVEKWETISQMLGRNPWNHSICAFVYYAILLSNNFCTTSLFPDQYWWLSKSLQLNDMASL